MTVQSHWVKHWNGRSRPKRVLILARFAKLHRVTGALIFGLAVAAIVALLWMMRNATLLFSAEVERGRIVSLRGRAPKGLVRDMNDVLRSRPVQKASIRVVVEGGLPALRANGDLNEGEQQRLRNVLGTWPLAKIRAAPYRTVRREGSSR